MWYSEIAQKLKHREQFTFKLYLRKLKQDKYLWKAALLFQKDSNLPLTVTDTVCFWFRRSQGNAIGLTPDLHQNHSDTNETRINQSVQRLQGIKEKYKLEAWLFLPLGECASAIEVKCFFQNQFKMKANPQLIKWQSSICFCEVYIQLLQPQRSFDLCAHICLIILSLITKAVHSWHS